ncbi:MAG: polyketide synthase, partial [Pirellulales bacterium]|nr:polyketide synthase [Pirellulales bacterium]
MNQQTQTPLAIIGAGCYVPGANSVDEYWSLLINGRYPITEIPATLFDRELYFDSKKGVRGKSYFEYAGFVDDLPYDPKQYPLPSRFEEFFDTLPKMMCRAAADACRDARMDPFDVRATKTGVYVGCNSTDQWSDEQQYGLMVGAAGDILAETAEFREMTGGRCDAIAHETVSYVRQSLSASGKPPSRMTISHINANAISEALGLTGPSVVLDATCSTSIKALAVARHDLEQGVADMAFVGGAYRHSLDALLQFSMNQVATRGVSRPFSDEADGVVISEGYIVVLVKTLDRALRDGDPIRAVVRGIGVSSDGKGKGVWAPRKEGQVEAIRRAYKNEDDMSHLDFYEGHVTSTTLGDLTEMETLTEVFAGKLKEKIPVGSVKANIGHTLEAAGLAGLVKSMLVLEHGVVPRQIHCETLNSRVNWESLPFYVPRQNTPLAERSDGKPRRAGVNAFGIGGLNTHAILEDPTEVLSSSGRTIASVPDISGLSKPTHSSSDHEPIAVIGWGAVLPGAQTNQEFEKLVARSKSVIGPAPEDRWSQSDWSDKDGVPQGGSVNGFDYDWRRHRISPKQIGLADPLMFMMLEAVDVAWQDAGLAGKEFDRLRTEVIVGMNFETDFFLGFTTGGRIPQLVRDLKVICRQHGFTDETRLDAVAEAFEQEYLRRHPGLIDEMATAIPSSFPSRIAKIYDVMGGAVAIESGDTSGLAAIAQAMGSLRARANNLVICVAGSRSIAQQLHANQRRSSSSTVSPAEGASAIVLKRLSDAERDGDPIHAVIHSVGIAHCTNARTAFRDAVDRAWDGLDSSHGDMTPTSVRCVELSPAPDVARTDELQAIKDFYGLYAQDDSLLIGSLDNLIGDSMATSGLAATIKASIQLEKQSVPGVVGQVRGLDGSTACPLVAPANTTDLLAKSRDERMLAAVSGYDSFGSAYHLILERGRCTAMQTATPPDYRSLISKSYPLNGEGELCADVHLDPTKHRMLVDHRLRDRPLLPGALTIESFAQAAVTSSGYRHVAHVCDVKFIDGLRFIDDT